MPAYADPFDRLQDPIVRFITRDSAADNLNYLFMKAQIHYITDGKGKPKAFLSVVHEKTIPYGEIEARLKKSRRI